VTRAVVALGANLGDRGAALSQAIEALAARMHLVAMSGLFETEPVGGPVGQPKFCNAVVLLDTELDAPGLLAVAHELEAAAGRERVERWGPRTLDVDIIAFGDAISADPILTLPHPRARERAFVLLPWLDADPAAVLPGVGPVTELIADLDLDGVRRIGELGTTRATG
jgi:2-amino-4-hydroxy-6-hydroxymethyldihydropteridine diphosphokinase